MGRSLGAVVLAIASLWLVRAAPLRAQEHTCVNLPRCVGCGCRGGPGYRGPDGRCVGYRDLARVCGTDPAKGCQFENSPNSGLNHDCIMGHHPAAPPS